MQLTEFLPIPRLRRELDLPDDYRDDDIQLTSLSQEAAAIIERVTGLPLLDREETQFAAPTAFSGLPLCLDTSFVQVNKVPTFRAWGTGQTLDEEPQPFTPAGSRFSTEDPRHGPYWLWIAGQWPERLGGTEIEVTFTRGIPATDQLFAEVARSCGVELVRQRKQGIRTMAPTNYTLRILEELKSL